MWSPARGGRARGTDGCAAERGGDYRPRMCRRTCRSCSRSARLALRCLRMRRPCRPSFLPGFITSWRASAMRARPPSWADAVEAMAPRPMVEKSAAIIILRNMVDLLVACSDAAVGGAFEAFTLVYERLPVVGF